MQRISVFAGILGGLLLVFGLVNYFSSSYWDTPTIVLVSAGGALILLYAVLNAGTLKDLVLKRTTQHFTNAVIASVLVLGIIAMANFILNKRNIRLDLTANKHYSLSDQTVSILRNLDKDVTITSFQQSTMSFYYDHIFTEMTRYTDKLTFESIDPDKKPRIAKAYGFKQYGEIYFECEELTDKVTSNEEQVVANALIRVTRGIQKSIYFTIGHGEHDINDSERTGYSNVREEIEAKNYLVKTLDLAREAKIPDDCSVLVVAGPRSALFPEELLEINRYLNTGGKALFLLDPAPSPGMNDFFASWGIVVGNDMVIEESGSGRLYSLGPEVPLVTRYSQHRIVSNFGRQNTFYPIVRSVTPMMQNGPEMVDLMWLARTTELSWAEVDVPNPDEQDNRVSVSFDRERDIEGPVPVAAVAEKRLFTGAPTNAADIKKGALVVFGDSDYANNAYSAHLPNTALFLNAVNWLAEEEDLVSIPPKKPEDRRVTMTDQQAKFVFYLTVFIIPGLILLSGMSVYIRRKSL